ncbi:VOC family protein [Antarctobacter jejuensis]|uniref:VOC family protein n=1 Tax=Antarctobacter jejuensis TaxID=1439938 RepID=UPI003FCF76D3
MPVIAFDHVNIRTAQLDIMVRWYGEILGLRPGPRPPFAFPGAWLYLGDQPYVHLVEKPAQAKADPGAALEHFALRATDMAAFLATLDAHQIAYSVDEVPEFPIVQVNFRDPDDNHIHVDFNKSEMPG